MSDIKNKLLSLKRKEKTVFVEEINDYVIVAEMSAPDYFEFVQKMKNKQEDEELVILYYSIVDENQNKIFSIEDLKVLKQKSMSVILKLIEAANEVNFTSSEDIKKN